MGELLKRLGPIQDRQYISTFGLTPAQAEYFKDKNTRMLTQAKLFYDVIRNAELNYITPEYGVITSTLRIKFGNINIIYGYVHSFGDPLEPQLYCISGHMVSQDGEYRKDLVPVRQYDATMRMFSEPVTMMIEHVRELVHTGAITIDIEHYGRAGAANTLNLGTLPYFVLSMGWFTDKLFLTLNIVDKHLYGAREKLINEFPGGDRLWSKIMAIDGFEHQKLVASGKYPDGINAGMNAGQKITPMTTLALASLHDITFPLWREIYVNEMVSMLVMNNVCTGYAYTPGWFYIESANARLFDGEASRRKYVNSDTAREIRGDIKAVQTKTLTSDNNYATDDPRHDIQSPINNQFAMLHSMLSGDIKFTDSHLIMSSYAICMVSIHTNVTVSNIAMLAKVDANIPLMKLPSFGRLLFDYLYSLYCLNVRVKAMHTDLHISNATVMRLNIGKSNEYGNTAYVIGEDIYSLPYIGVIGCIIDFSRAIIADTERLSRDYTPQYAAAVQTSQTQALADLIRRHFPAIHSQYGSRIRLLAEDHFDAFFQVCTVIDAYSLACGIAIMFDTQKEYRETKYARVESDLRAHVQNIIDGARDIFIDNMELLMHDVDAAKKSLAAKAPMLALIEKIYGDKRINWPPPDSDPVSHVVNSNNELKYSAHNLNPLVDPTEEVKIREDIGIAKESQSMRKRDYVFAALPAARKRIDEIARDSKPDDYDIDVVTLKRGGDESACPCGCASVSTDNYAGGCECDDTCDCAAECVAKNKSTLDVDARVGASERANERAINSAIATYGPLLI